jgi:hypothetical protein
MLIADLFLFITLMGNEKALIVGWNNQFGLFWRKHQEN